jgi:uncharacterized membrane protein HdeD (DUF308 family)
MTGMLVQLVHAWHWIALRGFFAVLFGIAAFIWPGITLAVLVLVWGIYAIVDGVLALVAAFRLREAGRPMWSLVVIGLLGSPLV